MRKINQLVGMAALVVFVFTFTQAISAHAATVSKTVVGCSRTIAKGKVETRAPFVRATVTLASDLTHQLASKVVPVRRDGSYKVAMSYPSQAKGTQIILAVGEWDGTQYVQPATTLGKACTGR